MTITLQALSLVEKAEPVQVRFTLRLRDQWSMWMQDGCKVYVDFYMGIKWITFHGHWDSFQKPPLGGRPNTKIRDHGTPNAHNHWYNLFYHVWGLAWIRIHWNRIWLRAQSHFTLHLRICDHTTWFEGFEIAFRHFLLGSHNFMVRALGTCVKWPLKP